MKLFPFPLGIICMTMAVPISITMAQSPLSITNQITEKDPVNLILYESRTANAYAAVAYMPYYPAYGLVTVQSPTCKAELTGFIDPFSLQKNRLVITYKKCSISFSQQKNQITNPEETEACKAYHPQSCNFSMLPTLTRTELPFTK